MNGRANGLALLVVFGLAVVSECPRLRVGLTGAVAANPPVGFQADRRVREATRLDWEFVAGAGARVPSGYDSRQQRYQLFVPEDYKSTATWPLLVFVSPGDAPLGWKTWQKPCEDEGWLFCTAVGAGNDCPPAQRIRAVCDVIDDVRRNYRIDPDRTYVAGFGGGAELACRLGVMLPEWFGGVILMSGDGELPGSDHLRERLRERLSVALVCGADDRARTQLEMYRLPLLTGLGVRTRLWVVPRQGHAMPPPAVLSQVQRWLEEDRKRRNADSRALGISAGETPSRFELASRAVARAKEDLRRPERTYRAAATLQWVKTRFGSTQTAEEARDVLKAIDSDPISARRLAEQTRAASRRLLVARASALEKAGQLRESRRAWQAVNRLADTPAQRQQAVEGMRRLAGLLARTPYLGLTLAGDTTVIRTVAPGGPAQRAGLRPGDRVDKVAGVAVEGPAAVRRQLQRSKPGDELRLEVVHGKESRAVVVKLGAVPVDE